MICGIYMIKNIVNGKIYIGQAVDIKRRWRGHKECLRGNQNKPNEHLQSAWNKYGEDNFEFTLICECDESQLNTKEIYYIAKLKTYDRDFGYNKTYGGEGGRPTEETRRKQSEACKGKYCGKNNPHYGKLHSEETKRKMRENHADFKGENHPNYGKHHSEETKEKMSEAHSIPIVQVDASTNKIVNVWDSSMEAERGGGYNPGNINKCCKGKLKTHGNYKWMYLKDWLKEHNKGIPKKLYFIN